MITHKHFEVLLACNHLHGAIQPDQASIALLWLTILSCRRESRMIACYKNSEHHEVEIKGRGNVGNMGSDIGKVEEWEARVDH